MKIMAPTKPSELSFENLQAYKSALHWYDLQRIANREVTPSEIQLQKAVIRLPRKVQVKRIPKAELLEIWPV